MEERVLCDKIRQKLRKYTNPSTGLEKTRLWVKIKYFTLDAVSIKSYQGTSSSRILCTSKSVSFSLNSNLFSASLK